MDERYSDHSCSAATKFASTLQRIHDDVSPNPEGLLFRVRMSLRAFWRRNFTSVTRHIQSLVNQPLARRDSAGRFLFLGTVQPAPKTRRFEKLKAKLGARG